MEDRELFQKLNSFKQVKMDPAFKKQNRELLLKQIDSGNNQILNGFSWTEAILQKIPMDYMRTVPRTALVSVFAFVFVLFSGYLGVSAAQDAKPGDSLYIAKIAGEKTQLVFTFDDKKKARLGLEFASNRAKEITLVLDEAGDDEEKKEKAEQEVNKLVDNFKKEISGARERIEKINKEKVAAVNKVFDKQEADKDLNDKENSEMEKEGDAKEGEEQESGSVFSANLEKDEKGIEVSGGQETGEEPEREIEAEAETEEIVIYEEASEAGTSSEGSKEASTTGEAAEVGIQEENKAEEIIDEARTLLEDENYTESLNKINEAEEAIQKVDLSAQEEEVLEGVENGGGEEAVPEEEDPEAGIDLDEAGDFTAASESASGTEETK